MIYFIGSGLNEPVKIGHAKEPPKRLSELQTANPSKLSLLCTMSGDKQLETAFHRVLSPFWIRGEWFHFAPVRELLERVFKVPVPDTDLGMEYPGATDGCERCDDKHLKTGWPESRSLINYPVDVVENKNKGLRFRYKCDQGHSWTCWYCERVARFGFDVALLDGDGLIRTTGEL